MRLVTWKPGLAAMAVTALSSCSDEEPTPNPPAEPGTLVEVAGAAGFTKLLAAATAAGLADALAGPGPLTVFAPTDAAFDALGGAAPSDPDLLANVLLHHVVAGRLSAADVTSGRAITSLANLPLAVNASGAPIRVGGRRLSSTVDVAAKNGIIHVLDEVIVPPTVLEAAAATGDLSTLVTAVGAASAGIRDALATGPITVFAPTNAAFAKLPAADLDALLADRASLDLVLSYHVVAGQILAADLRDGQTLTTVAGQPLRVKIAGGTAKLVDATGAEIGIAATDLRLLNGAVHLVDAVLMPERAAPAGTIVEVATAAGGFGALLQAATRAGLADALAGPGPLTVFAPTDAAFGALGIDLSKVDAKVIANVLLHHVVSGDVRSSAVASRSSLATLANTALDVEMGSPIKIGGAALSSTLDVTAANGVIHVMSEVIVPPTLLEVAVATPDLSTLVSAVGAASDGVKAALAPDTLAGAAPITVFAPTNAAFAAAGIDLASLPQATLDAVLAHHVVGAQALSTELSDAQVIGALNGNLTVDLGADGRVTIVDGKGGRANVIATLKDIRTLTGVVHVIDAVLMP